MDALSDPAVHTVVCKKSAQVGWTEILLNVVGYYVDQDPSPMILIQPTLDLAEAFSKDRLAPMVRDTPDLRGKVADAGSKKSGNTLLHKTFPGGHVTLAGANSPSSLASRPVRVVLCDEVDRYPASAGTEGDPIDLVAKRATTFWNRKKLEGSTPVDEATSRINVSFELSDKRFFFIPCPVCGHYQSLRFDRVKWDEGNSNTARYECEECDSPWDDAARWRAVRLGEWRATAPFSGIAGFHVWEAYSSWVRLRDTVDAFLKAKDKPERLKTFVNTALGECWKDKGDAPEWKRLYDCREHYAIGTVPLGGIFLTAGVDIQKDRIEVSIYAWGRNKESWLVDYVVLDGDTSLPDVWVKLSNLLNMTYPHPCGLELPIIRMAVDSGYATQEVYNWARQYAGTGRVMVVKGVDKAAAIVGIPTAVDVSYGGRKIQRGMKVWPVASGLLKSELYGWLRLEKPTEEKLAEGVLFSPGFCHFPEMGEEFFRQLTAEQLVTGTDRRGYRKAEWVKTRERNEALDTRLYARAAAYVHGMDRFRESDWEHLEGNLRVVPGETQQRLTPSPQASSVQRGPRVWGGMAI